MTSVIEALTSAQFVVNAEGERIAVQLDMKAWESLLNWLEDQEDQKIVKAIAPLLLDLKQGQSQERWLRWDEVRDEWDEAVEVANV